MSVYPPKKSPYWHYDFQLDGRRFHGSTEATNRRDAKRVEQVRRVEAQKAIAEERARAAAGVADMTVDVACGRYWEEVGKHHRNADMTWAALSRFIAHFGAVRRLAEITDADLASIVAARRAEGVTNATVNRTVIEPLARIIGRAQKVWGASVPRPPNFKEHRLPEPRERTRELSTDEEARLVAAIRDDYRPLLAFAIMTGVRQANALHLTWPQVDEPAGVIRLIMKGEEPHVIPITSDVADILDGCRGHHETHVFTFVVHQPRGSRRKGERHPITKDGLRRMWKNALRAAGITDYRWHDNRHTALTRVLRETGNLRIAQRLAGHHDITTTAKYAHAVTDDVRAAMELVAEARRKQKRDAESRKNSRNPRLRAVND
jgi:integrase